MMSQSKPHTLIIAEAGVNHNGDLATAKRLIEAGADAGADYVKFQTFKAENLVSRDAALAQYQKENIGDADNSQLQMLRKLQLSPADHYALLEHAAKCNIRLCSTPFDLESVDFLSTLGFDFWKIPSGEITNFPLLRKIALQGGKIIMSTGMCTPEEIHQAVSVLLENGAIRENITLLHCNTQYPTPMEDANLMSIPWMAKEFGLPIGYSDHTLGIEAPIAAVALGAKVVEKHFTLDRNMPGPDHKASLEPAELKAMVSAIRNIEMAMGEYGKKVTESERSNIDIARKSIVAKRQIKKGEIFTEENLTTKRPGNGISPMQWPSIIGQTAKRDFLPDEKIEIK